MYIVEYNPGTTIDGTKKVIKPEIFAIAQNYPNPFNPNSCIEFDVQKNSHVTKSV